MIINWQKPSEKVSRFFTVSEVIQDDWRRIPPKGSNIEKNIRFLAVKLDTLRDIWGSPIGVTSWYRPPLVNAEARGVSNSQHLTGGAADIYTYSGNDQEFERFLDIHWRERALGYGIAAGRGFTHLDLRLGGARWDY